MSYGACFGALNAQHPNSYRVRTDGPQLWPGWKRPEAFRQLKFLSAIVLRGLSALSTSTKSCASTSWPDVRRNLTGAAKYQQRLSSS